MEKINKNQKIKYIITIFLIVISWSYAIWTYRENKSEIIIYLDDMIRRIALPYHIARLYLEEPVSELSMPVYGVLRRDVADTWGEARSEGRSHEGTDIFARRNALVFSSTRGYVTRLNFGSRGGTNIMVAGPGGVYYYYAHLERIADGIEVGTAVTPDTVLGFVGNSGNASGTPPHLHFGMYEGGRFGAKNPYPMIVDR